MIFLKIFKGKHQKILQNALLNKWNEFEIKYKNNVLMFESMFIFFKNSILLFYIFRKILSFSLHPPNPKSWCADHLLYINKKHTALRISQKKLKTKRRPPPIVFNRRMNHQHGVHALIVVSCLGIVNSGGVSISPILPAPLFGFSVHISFIFVSFSKFHRLHEVITP